MTIKPVTRGIPAERSFHQRYGSHIVILLLVLAPIVAWGLVKAQQSSNNNIRQWLPSDLPESLRYEQFRSHFGSDEFAIVSWEGCMLDDPRLTDFTARILKITARDMAEADPSLYQQLTHRIDRLITGIEVDTAPADMKLFAEAMSGPSALKELLAAPFAPPLTQAQASARLQGILIGKDHRTTCAILRLTRAGNENRVMALRAIEHVAAQVGVAPNALRTGGDPVVNAVIDIESKSAIDQLTVFAALASLVVALICLRSVRMTLIVLVVSGYSAAVSYALVYFTGGEMNLMLVVMPVLVFVLTMSGAIHMANYYRDEAVVHGQRGAMDRAIRAGWMPCFLSATTTSLGLVSLTVSHVQPVRQFGLYGAAGVMLSLLFIFLLLPTLLIRYAPRVAETAPDETAARPDAGSAVASRLAGWILRRRYLILIACLLPFVVAIVGVPMVRTSVKIGRFFPADHHLIRDVTWLESHIGSLVPIEVVLTFDHTNTLTLAQRLRLVRDIQQSLAALPRVGGTLSAATYGPPDAPPPDANITAPSVDPFQQAREVAGEIIYRTIFKRYRYHSDTQDKDDAPGVERWRITARFASTTPHTFDEVLRQVETHVTAALAARDAEETRGITPSFTGAVALFYAAQHELFTGLFKSYLLAFALITVTLAILLRGVGAGLVAMLPNVFPAVLVLGFMGMFELEVDIGAMLTASVAMGIAVDGTLHMLTWIRRSILDGDHKDEAIAHAYRRCAAALAQSAFITAASLLVFFFAEFQPVRQFGTLMGLMLLAALVGDLLLLPALLATRAGKLFTRRLASPPKAQG
ncbi:MAG: MMPL family transporter [Phycisphaeraceae bacterium]